MADIFLSYSRPDLSRARQFVLELEKLGWSVFWDRELLPGEDYRRTIEHELKESHCVIVLWSKTSIKREWVIDEAEFGKQKGHLVSVRIDDVEMPLGFRQLQAATLVDWSGRCRARRIRASDPLPAHAHSPQAGSEPPPPPPDPAHQTTERRTSRERTSRRGVQLSLASLGPSSGGGTHDLLAVRVPGQLRSNQPGRGAHSPQPGASRPAIPLSTPSGGSRDISASSCTTRPAPSCTTGIPSGTSYLSRALPLCGLGPLAEGGPASLPSR